MYRQSSNNNLKRLLLHVLSAKVYFDFVHLENNGK